jgi:transitional endoplasmic reticulum ATPase
MYEVVEAYDRKDVGKGIARVDYNVMRSLGICIGNIIKISGKKKATTAMCMLIEPAREKENKCIVGIDRLTRYNARIAIGEFIRLSKTNGIAADKIIMKPLAAVTTSKTLAIDDRTLPDALTDVPIRPIDVVVIRYFKIGLAFMVSVSFNLIVNTAMLGRLHLQFLQTPKLKSSIKAE